jgi:hypothetical protein
MQETERDRDTDRDGDGDRARKEIRKECNSQSRDVLPGSLSLISV